MTVTAQFVEAFEPLFQPWRYKVYFGGRSAGRSWGFARALLILGTQKPLRTLCARELQNSIAESVHKLLADQIGLLDLGGEYVIQRDRIFHRSNGTEFFFEGIKNNTKKIKSYEGIDVCWVEEAEAVSKDSWQILIPTIRKAGSEIWITFNPELENNFTYQHFVITPRPNSVVMKMTYKDNPWLSAETLVEIEDSRRNDPDTYAHVWGGNPKRILAGVVYAKELRRAEDEGRITRVTWARESAVDTFWDLGKRDHTSIWFAQRVGMQYRVLEFYENTGHDIMHYLKFCDARPYAYGTFYLPHDAKHQRLGVKRTIEQMVRDGGRRETRVLPRLSVVDGINAGRVLFGQLWFDQVLCAQGLARLRAYRYRVSEQGGYSESPLHDESSDAADAYRTMAVGLRTEPMGSADVLDKLRSPAVAPPVWTLGQLRQRVSTAWMRR